MVSIWLRVVFVLVFTFLTKRVISHLFDPLRVIPGPFLARFTRLWYLFDTLKGSTHETMYMLHQKYGMISRYFFLGYHFINITISRLL